jgi:hypothetical protein
LIYESPNKRAYWGCHTVKKKKGNGTAIIATFMGDERLMMLPQKR